MPGTPLAGTNGRVAIGGVALTQAKWNVKWKGASLPSTNFESVDAFSGITFSEGIFGIVEAEVSFSGFWDAGANPHSTFNLRGGQIITNVQIFVQKSALRCFTFASFRVVDVTVDDDVTGMLMISVNGLSNGLFTFPT